MPAARCRVCSGPRYGWRPCSSPSASVSGRSIQLTVALLLPLWVRSVHSMAPSRQASRTPLSEAFLTAAGLCATWTWKGALWSPCPRRVAVCVGGEAIFHKWNCLWSTFIFPRIKNKHPHRSGSLIYVASAPRRVCAFPQWGQWGSFHKCDFC